LVKALLYKRILSPTASLEFIIDIILPVALLPWGRLSLWQKWVPGIFTGGWGEGPVSKADNLTIFICRLSRNSGSL